jgi:hypothetical protein
VGRHSDVTRTCEMLGRRDSPRTPLVTRFVGKRDGDLFNSQREQSCSENMYDDVDRERGCAEQDSACQD